MLLEVKNLTAAYGNVVAINDVSCHVGDNEIVALIGPNGAGKSTTLKAICGLMESYNGKIKSGEILFQNENVCGLKPYQLVKKGMVLIPENRHVFTSMTIRENLEMGGYTIPNKNKWIILERIEEIFAMFPVLKERMKQKAGTLSTGEQQMLAIGRALMLRPKLLLADEPSLGLSPNYIEQIFEKFSAIIKTGISLLIVEQNAHAALELCDRAYVFNIGTIQIEGTKEELLNDDRIRRTYLGV